MAVGLGKSKPDIDFRSGTLAIQVRNTFDEVVKFKQFLDVTPNADLEALGYTTQEVAVLKSSFTDLKKLNDIYRGTETQTPAYNFQTFSGQLMGVQ